MLQPHSRVPATMASQPPQRPAWLNWLFLGIFLWSSWQLAGLWFARLGQG
jgi:hypothetical protein